MSDTGDTTAEGTEGAPDPVAQLDQRFNEFASGFDQKFDTLREALTPQPEAEPDPDPWSEMFGAQEPDDDPYAPEGPELDPDQARMLLEHSIQQAVNPLQQQVQEIQLRGEAERIAQQYPGLRDPETVQKTFQAAQREAAAIGRPDLATNPHFMKQTYLAGLAQEQALRETPAGASDEVRIDGPGGVSSPGWSADDEGDAIVNAARGHRPFG